MYKNHEGYTDKTAYEAIRRTEKESRKRKKKLWNVKSTYYYIAEAESGGEEDNSPSCLVVVGNYSTEPFEITVKMLVENNEVVDSTGMANGYGEYAEFHNTQKFRVRHCNRNGSIGR